MEESLSPPRVGRAGIVEVATTALTVGVERIVLRDLSRAGVGDVGYAGLAVDGPYLLAGGGDLDLDVLRGVAHAQTEGAPGAVDAHGTLIRRDDDGGRDGGDAGQQLVVGRVGDVLLDILGLGAGQEQDHGGKDAGVGVTAATASQQEHGRR